MKTLGLALPALLCLSIATPFNSYAAGMMTHAYSAERGVEYMPEGAIRSLLEANIGLVNAGAAFPDGGYFSGNTNALHREAAEHAHWGNWVNDYIEYVKTEHTPPLGGDAGCDANAAEAQFAIDGTFGWDNSCTQLIAFLMGNAAHGVGDEAWDRLFEDVVRHRDEELETHSSNPIDTIEYLMDAVMIVDHNRTDDAIVDTAPVAVVNVFKKNAQFDSLTEADVESMAAATRSLTQAEVSGSQADSNRARLEMPWSSSNYFTHAGGVVDLAQMIARMYEHMWQKLKDAPGTASAPKVIGTWPEHNQTQVPWDMADLRNTGQRDAHLFGRIYAFLGNYANPDSLVEGSICLFEEDGTRVPGLVYTGPFQDHANSTPAPAHIMWFKPDNNLKPDTEYYVVVSQEVKDLQRIDEGGKNLVRSNVWSFVTTASLDQTPENYVFTKP